MILELKKRIATVIIITMTLAWSIGNLYFIYKELYWSSFWSFVSMCIASIVIIALTVGNDL